MLWTRDLRIFPLPSAAARQTTAVWDVREHLGSGSSMMRAENWKAGEKIWLEALNIREGLDKLTPREKKIIDLRFFVGKTQMEVAAEIGISQAQVSRLEKSALKQLEKYVRS